MGARVNELVMKPQDTSELEPKNSKSEAFRIIAAIAKAKGGSISVDRFDEYEKVFPGYSVEAFNLIVPHLVKGGWLSSVQLSFRDGPIIEITKKSIEFLQRQKMPSPKHLPNK